MSPKKFTSRYGYDSVKMFVRQIAIAIFGLVIAIATKGGLQIASSAFAVLFYLFLIYDIAFTVGSKDSTSKSVKPSMLTGFYISLIANIPNIILAVLYAVGYAVRMFENSFCTVLTKIGGVSASIALMIEGMFTGMMTLNIAPDVPLNTQPWAYFVIVLLPIIVSTVAYIFGYKDIRATSLLVPTTPEDEERKRDKKREKKGREGDNGDGE